MNLTGNDRFLVPLAQAGVGLGQALFVYIYHIGRLGLSDQESAESLAAIGEAGAICLLPATFIQWRLLTGRGGGLWGALFGASMSVLQTLAVGLSYWIVSESFPVNDFVVAGLAILLVVAIQMAALAALLNHVNSDSG